MIKLTEHADGKYTMENESYAPGKLNYQIVDGILIVDAERVLRPSGRILKLNVKSSAFTVFKEA